MLQKAVSQLRVLFVCLSFVCCSQCSSLRLPQRRMHLMQCWHQCALPAQLTELS